jgi:hypothetical protein
MMITLKRFLTQQVNFTRSSHFATPPLSHAVAHPLPLAGEGMIMAIRGFNPLARLRERVGERGGFSIAQKA